MRKNQTIYIFSILILVFVIFFSRTDLVDSPKIDPVIIPKTWSKSIPHVNYSSYDPIDWVPKYTSQVSSGGNVHLDGDDTLLIENCTYFLNGVLIAKNNSRIIVQNAELCIEEKISWNYLDPLSIGYHFDLRDNSSLVFVNSSLVYPEHIVRLGFFDKSSALIRNSKLEFGTLNGNDEAEINIMGSDVHKVGLVQNASGVIINSEIYSLSPTDPFVRDSTYQLGASVYVENSDIGSLQLGFNGASFQLIEPASHHFASFSILDRVGSDCEAFWVELQDTDVGKLSIYAYDSNIILENQNIHIISGTGPLRMRNVTCHFVSVGMGSISISDSVIGMYNPHHEGIQIIQNSRLGRILLNSFYGICHFENVLTDSISGHDSDCVLSGSLTTLNDISSEPWHSSMKLEREYPIVVCEEGYAVKGANLRLINSDGKVCWTGSSGFFGEAEFSLTFFNRKQGYTYYSNMTASYELEIECNGLFESRQITVLSNTPIIFDFSK